MFFLDHSTSAQGLIAGLSLLVAELSLLVAELSSLLVRLVAELSPLYHVSGHAEDSLSSSRRSTTSPVTLGTPRRALVTTSHQP
jgi:hypothetical protein